MVKEFVSIEDLTQEDRLALIELNRAIYKPFECGLEHIVLEQWAIEDVVRTFLDCRTERYKDCSTDCILQTDGNWIWVIDTYKYDILFQGYYDEIKSIKVVNQNYVFNKALEKEIYSFWGC